MQTVGNKSEYGGKCGHIRSSKSIDYISPNPLLKEQLFIQLWFRWDSHEPDARVGEHGAPQGQARQFDGNVPLAARELDHAQEGGADTAQWERDAGERAHNEVPGHAQGPD